MDETLKKVIQKNTKGLFLLDPPTGFGKTFTVNNIIRNFLTNAAGFPSTKRMFFITNLKGNISYFDVIQGLSNEERQSCLYARALSEAVIENFQKVDIPHSEITNSKEYNDLKIDIEAYHSLMQFDKDALTKNDGIRKSLNALENKISCDTEPSFRKFIKNRYFYNKSSVEKKKFVRDNAWLRLLYPICDIEKYKVIFMTTKRFVLPFDTFQRMPFYIYDDDITKDSIIFIDEFDATKGEILNQIIEDGIKNKIDIVKLFIDINFALQNLVIPQKLLHTSTYHKARQTEANWKETQEHFKEWREKFAKLFEECNINYLIKSVGLDADRTFLFDDGRSFNVIKDSSKKFLYTNLDQNEQILALKGLSSQLNKEQVGVMIRKLENHIDGFARILFYVANNYMYYKNEPKDNFETKYTFEEALFTVLDALNLSDEEKDYLFKKVFNYDFSFQKPSIDDGIRRGFNYTEIEDSDYHDAKSIIHNYNFHTTPEDIVVKLCNKAFVVGISATARIKTCIGNYDLSYLSKRLGTLMIDVDAKDYERIATEFNRRLEITSGYHIHPKIIDDVDCFSNREKCKEIICTIFDSIDLQDKYLTILADKEINSYYFLIELKLATIYYDMKQKRFKSFVAFLNSFPKDNTNNGINRQRLLQLFADIDMQYNEFPIIVEIVKASNYNTKMQVIHQELSLGKAVFVLTTYNTIGSGKNIQYPIPKSEIDNVIMSPLDKHGTKDFEAIYLLTPTNLIQSLSYKSDHKYDELAKFLFQQEYLYYNGQLTYYEMKNNISNGFRHTFYHEKDAPFYTKNGDIYDNSLRLIIQAIGRICRCQNKNKDIYIYSDKEVVERIKIACEKSTPKLLNAEFNALLQMDIGPTKISGTLTEYSRQSKKTYVDISKASYSVRRSVENVKEWKLIRDYVLRNPTTDSVSEKYAEYYFKFDDRYTGYCYKFGSNYNIADIKTDLKYSDMQQVSDQDCDLSLILNAKPYLMDFFKRNNYATTFKKGYYIMNPSLYKQIYWGALGEVVGREILDKELGWDIEELEDVSMYEYFDFKLGDIYFDFKHWDEFRTDNNKYVKKIERKLNKVKGSKCFVINLVKRTNAKPKINIGDTVVQVPYLIDAEIGLLNNDAIDYIQELYDQYRDNKF